MFLTSTESVANCGHDGLEVGLVGDLLFLLLLLLHLLADEQGQSCTENSKICYFNSIPICFGFVL